MVLTLLAANSRKKKINEGDKKRPPSQESYTTRRLIFCECQASTKGGEWAVGCALICIYLLSSDH